MTRLPKINQTSKFQNFRQNLPKTPFPSQSIANSILPQILPALLLRLYTLKLLCTSQNTILLIIEYIFSFIKVFIHCIPKHFYLEKIYSHISNIAKSICHSFPFKTPKPRKNNAASSPFRRARSIALLRTLAIAHALPR